MVGGALYAFFYEPACRVDPATGQPGDTAFWGAAVTTAKDGTAEVEVAMPENLTTWRIKVWGMGHGTKVGEGVAEVVTRKNLMIRLQAPRFFVQKDEDGLQLPCNNTIARSLTA